MQRRTMLILFLVLWIICIAITIPNSQTTIPDDGSAAYRAGVWTGSRLLFPAVLAAIITLVIAGGAYLVSRIRR